MGKKTKIAKQTPIDYLYQCRDCHISAHEPEPAVAVCPICRKRMDLISWPLPDILNKLEQLKAKADKRRAENKHAQ